MKIKCPICGETTELENKQCEFCGSEMAIIRKTLIRQKELAHLKEKAVLTTKELDELFEFEESGTGYAIKEYLGLENIVFLPSKYRGKAINAIAPHAFESSDIEEIYMSESIRNIMHHAFADCFKLRKVSISGRCRVIERNAFSNCVELEKIRIPESVGEIGKFAFDGCVRLRKIDLPERLETIEEGTFENCISLPYFIVPAKVKTIGSNSFSNCESIKKIKFNEGLLSIGFGAFSSCSSLERALLPESVTALGDFAFQDCKSLRALYIGKSLAEFSGLAFYGCNELCLFKVSEENRTYKVLQNGVINFNASSLILGGKQTEIDETTKSISAYAFSGSSFEGVLHIPESIISIEKNAFYNTSNFTLKVEASEKPQKWSDNWLLGENEVLWGREI